MEVNISGWDYLMGGRWSDSNKKAHAPDKRVIYILKLILLGNDITSISTPFALRN